MQHLLKILILYYGILCSLYANPKEEIDTTSLHKTLEEVISIIKDRYPGTVTTQTLRENMLKGILNSLENSAYLNSKELQQMLTLCKGESKGFGIAIIKAPEGLHVVKVFKNSAAAKEGIQVNDILIQLDDQSLKKVDTADFAKIITENRPYKIHLKRKGKLLKKIITPAAYYINTLDLQWIKDIAYIKVSFIHEQAAQEMRECIHEIQHHKNAKGIIFDIRNAPGGSFQAAVNMISGLLNGDVIVEFQGKKYVDKAIASGPDLLPNIPIVILQNKYSCSAVEMIAASLKASKRATLMGQPTAGVATIKELIGLPDESDGFIMSVAFVNDKNGKRIGKEGVFPDINLKETPIPENPLEDKAVQYALQFLHKPKR